MDSSFHFLTANALEPFNAAYQRHLQGGPATISRNPGLTVSKSRQRDSSSVGASHLN